MDVNKHVDGWVCVEGAHSKMWMHLTTCVAVLYTKLDRAWLYQRVSFSNNWRKFPDNTHVTTLEERLTLAHTLARLED